MTDLRETNTQRLSAIMFLVAGMAFLLTAFLGDAGADAAFFVLGLVFVVFSTAGRSAEPRPSDRTAQANAAETLAVER